MTQRVPLMRFSLVPWDTRRLATAGLSSGFTCVRPTRPFQAGAVLFAILTQVYLLSKFQIPCRLHSTTCVPLWESFVLAYLPPTPIAVTRQPCSSLVLNIGCAENRNEFVDSATVPTPCTEWDRMDEIKIGQRSSVITMTSLHAGWDPRFDYRKTRTWARRSLLSNECFGFFSKRYSRRGGKLNNSYPSMPKPEEEWSQTSILLQD